MFDLMRTIHPVTQHWIHVTSCIGLCHIIQRYVTQRSCAGVLLPISLPSATKGSRVFNDSATCSNKELRAVEYVSAGS